jgi:hypothetical protein
MPSRARGARADSLVAMTQDEFRVEVELDDEGHGLPLSERLRAVDLDDEARERLGGRVIVTRDGSHLFLYTNTRESCAEAERVVRELLVEDELSGDVRATRWHPVAEEWKPADEPLPESPEDIEAEQRERADHEDSDDGLHAPGFVLLGSYKPAFLRDLGL